MSTLNSCNRLFIYGTLMKGIQTGMSLYLHSNSRLLSNARLSGYLYDVGAYPAVIYDKNAVSSIEGEVVEIDETEKVLAVLDEYEGLEYERKLLPVQTGTEISPCWVYIYVAEIKNLRLIESGDYLGYLNDS